MPKGTKSDIDFKKMIADLFNSKQMTALEIEREIGVTNSTIYSWANKFSNNPHVKSKISKQKQFEKKLKLLEKQNKQLKMENDILKKAGAIFAANQLDKE